MKRILPTFAALLIAGCQPAAERSDQLVLSGNLELVDAQLSFKYPGRVAERLVDEGQRVKAGQLLAKLDDSEQVQEVALRRAELAAAKALLAELEAGFRRLGLEWIPSVANFISVRVPRRDGKPMGGFIFNELLKRSVIVRPLGGYGMPDHLRVTVGNPEENARFLAALEQSLKA